MYRVTVIKQGATIYRKTGSFAECVRIYDQLTADLYPGTITIEIKTTLSMVQQHRKARASSLYGEMQNP